VIDPQGLSLKDHLARVALHFADATRRVTFGSEELKAAALGAVKFESRQARAGGREGSRRHTTSLNGVVYLQTTVTSLSASALVLYALFPTITIFVSVGRVSTIRQGPV
jgi:hypothetical protein